LGLANNLYCLGTCAPVLVPYVFGEGEKQSVPLAKYLSGRLIAYLIFAVASGAVGIYFNGRLDPRVFACLTILLALWLIAYSAGKLLGIQRGEQKSCFWFKRHFSGKYLPLYAGMVMGLNLCPPFLLGLDRTLQMGTLTGPILFFIGFYFGSSVWMIMFLFTGKLKNNKETRLIGQLTSLLVGLWFLGQALVVLFA